MLRFNIAKIEKITKKIATKEVYRLLLKSLFYNKCLEIPFSYGQFFFFLEQFEKCSKNSSKVRFANYCLNTGYKRSVNRRYKLTRMKVREFALAGLLPGLKKGSW